MSEQLTATLEPPKVETNYVSREHLEAEQLAAEALRKKLFYSEPQQHLLPPPENGHLLPSGQQRRIH